MTVAHFKPLLPGVRGKDPNKVEECRDDKKTEREEAVPPVSPESKRQKVESIDSPNAQSGPPPLPNLSEECDEAQQDKTAATDKVVIDLTNSGGGASATQDKSLSDQDQQSEEMSVAKVLTSMNGHCKCHQEFAVSNI